MMLFPPDILPAACSCGVYFLLPVSLTILLMIFLRILVDLARVLTLRMLRGVTPKRAAINKSFA
jgi:hypothetical protein